MPVPQHDASGRRLRRLLRGAGRRGGHHDRRAAGRPPGRERRRSSRANTASRPASSIFDDVFVPWERVFLAGEWEHSGFLTTTYATHHRHTCIGARAGFGDLLIGAGALMTEANGLDPDARTATSATRWSS